MAGIDSRIAQDLSIPLSGVTAVLALLKEGSTVPFIARYRKEKTGALDEVQIRNIEEKSAYLTELESRRKTVLDTIAEQGKLTDALRGKILAADTKATLEDLYAPYKPKRRTRGVMAKERGLMPLAERILNQADDGDPAGEAASFVSAEKDVPDVEAALKGARDIVAEVLSDSAEARSLVRETYLQKGVLKSEGREAEPTVKTKFDDYRDFEGDVKDLPSHRFFAIRRGEQEGVLRSKLAADLDAVLPTLEKMMELKPSSPWAAQMREAVRDGCQRILRIASETDVMVELKMRSDKDAVGVFAENLRNLLLAAPLGEKTVIGIDPGLRTGCKVAVVDSTGRFVENQTLYLTAGAGKKAEAEAILLALVHRHQPAAIAVGNGTGGRETETFVKTALKGAGVKDVIVVPVNEAGASVYSASDVAREEFPELDLTVRGAISIARRLQDPLAELVKIEPKAIGVGQYQHDVHQPLLSKKLDEVIEDCVNKVGVELNTASAPLLSRVAGLGPSVAKKIVKHREDKGRFVNRAKLLDVSGLGPSTFEQAAGFLRIRDGVHPLDASAVHPERYALVEGMAKDLGVDVKELVGNAGLVGKIDIARYVSDDVGELTLKDILDELKKPGRDPRETFEPPNFRDDVNTLEDLKLGMQLEGVVTNVTNFGAFVDVGVHQDGLVHISKLADRFVSNPHDVVKPGDKLKVRVLEVDLERRRISLSARQDEGPGAGQGERRDGQGASGKRGQGHQARGGQSGGGKGRGDNGRGGGGQRGGRGPDRGQRQGQGSGQPSGPGNGFSNNPFADLLRR